jgi:hypothetical protein
MRTGTQGPLRNIARKRLPVKGLAVDDRPGGTPLGEQQTFRHPTESGRGFNSLQRLELG